MEYRNLFIANPAKLSVRQQQLVIRQEQEFTVPLEDISSILLESPRVTITTAAISAMAEAGLTVFFCDARHLPNAIALPVNQYCRQRKLLLSQANMTKPLQKQLCSCLSTPGFAMDEMPWKPIKKGFLPHCPRRALSGCSLSRNGSTTPSRF